MKCKAAYFVTLCLLYACGLHAQIITTFAGSGIFGSSGDGGLATNAQFFAAIGVCVDKKGNAYLVENNLIHKVDTNGVITRFAGNGITGYSGDGGPATDASLSFSSVVGIAADSSGNVYFSAPPVIRLVSTTGIITTVVGNGSYGYSGDGGPATSAKLNDPEGICFDKSGNIYITDAGISNNNIRKVNSSGIISTVAGNGTLGFSGDGGPATNAQLFEPIGIAADDSDNIYIADLANVRIRKITKAGIISTVAGGDPLGVTDCYGCPATILKLNAVMSVAIDRFGNIYFADAGNERIHKMDKDGLVHTFAGNGTTGNSGDGGAAPAAQIHDVRAICFDNAGNMLIADTRNYRFRKVWYATSSVPPVYKNSSQLSIFPNPVSHNEFTCNISSAIDEDANVAITTMLGQVVLRTSCTTNKPTVITLNAPPGLYFITAHTAGGKITSKLVVE